jgi:amidohydrolase
MIDFKAQAEALKDEVIAFRRDFHKHPEIGFEEVRTAGIVAGELQKLGLEVQTGIGKTGVVGILEGAMDGPTILFRADMDALMVQEDNDVEYASSIPGKMHACGHDAHTAIALGVAKVFATQRAKMAGRIKFVFQPAEEIGTGATAMIADGVLENPRPDVSLGLHVWNSMPFGYVGVTDGPSMAGASGFDIKITGLGGHGAQPETTVDPVVCATQLINAWQTIVSRNISPLDTAVISVTQMKASDAFNIIPESVTLVGTTRAFTIEVRDLIETRMRDIADSLCAAMGCKAEFNATHDTKPVENDAQVAIQVRKAFSRLMPAEHIITDERTMGGEDMSFLMEDIPGTFVFLGSKNDERGLNYSHHHPRFDIDEDCLPFGVELMSAAIASYVIPEK